MAISLPERTASAVGSLTPRADRRRAGQVRRRPGQGQARRGHRPAQPHPPAAAAARDGRRGHAEEHPDDRPDRRRQDRDRPAARAKLAQSPFIKVEASKFTEVGYVGRDVESMVRDLVELAVDMVRAEKAEEVGDKARAAAEERLLDLLLPPTRGSAARPNAADASAAANPRADARAAARRPPRRAHRGAGGRARPPMPSFEVIAGSSAEEICVNLKDMMGKIFQGRTKTRRLQVPEALDASRRPRSRPSWSTWSRWAAPPCSASSRAASSSSTRSTRSRAATAARRTRPRRQPRGRAARHPADRRRHDREHQARHGEDRSHPVHRRRRVPRVEAVGSHSRAAGALSDPRRAGAADARRLRAHPHRAARTRW